MLPSAKPFVDDDLVEGVTDADHVEVDEHTGRRIVVEVHARLLASSGLQRAEVVEVEQPGGELVAHLEAHRPGCGRRHERLVRRIDVREAPRADEGASEVVPHLAVAGEHRPTTVEVRDGLDHPGAEGDAVEAGNALHHGQGPDVVHLQLTADAEIRVDQHVPRLGRHQQSVEGRVGPPVGLHPGQHGTTRQPDDEREPHQSPGARPPGGP